MHYQEEKLAFVQALNKRLKEWVIRVLNLCETLPQSSITRVINYQLIKSSTSTGANYRAACRARSKKEFFAKISITLEEADESLYWLEIVHDKRLKCRTDELKWLMKEADEFVKIFSKSRQSTRFHN